MFLSKFFFFSFLQNLICNVVLDVHFRKVVIKTLLLHFFVFPAGKSFKMFDFYLKFLLILFFGYTNLHYSKHFNKSL